jgi:hypothetical protein
MLSVLVEREMTGDKHNGHTPHPFRICLTMANKSPSQRPPSKRSQKKGQVQPAQTSKRNNDLPNVSNKAMSTVATAVTGTTSKPPMSLPSETGAKSSVPLATSSNPPTTSSDPPIYTTTASKPLATDAEDGDKRNVPPVQTNKSSDPPVTSSNPPTTSSNPPIYTTTASKPPATVAEDGDKRDVPPVQTNTVPVDSGVIDTPTASKPPATVAEDDNKTDGPVSKPPGTLVLNHVPDPVPGNTKTASKPPATAVTIITPQLSERGATTTVTTPTSLAGANDVSVVT